MMPRRRIIPTSEWFSWGPKPGQEIVGEVLVSDLDGAKDMKGYVCPYLEIRLREPVDSIRKDGVITRLQPGDVTKLTCSTTSLKALVRDAKPLPGWGVWVRFASLHQTADGAAKIFELEVDDGDVLPIEVENSDGPPPF
jgi:hypothetical protein